MPQTTASSSPSWLLEWVKGASEVIGKMESKPFLNAYTWILTVSWNR